MNNDGKRTNPDKGQHVSSENNPANSASSGLSAVQLKKSNLLKGPDFLWQQNLPREEEMVGEVETTEPELCKAHAVKRKNVNSMVNHIT